MVWESVNFIYKACYDCRYSHIVDYVLNYLPTYVIQNKTLWQPSWESTHLRCCNIISQRFCNDTCIMVRQPTLSQRRSVTLSANNLVIHNVVATFLGVYI